jgi:hypothetical protein
MNGVSTALLLLYNYEVVTEARTMSYSHLLWSSAIDASLSPFHFQASFQDVTKVP